MGDRGSPCIVGWASLAALWESHFFPPHKVKSVSCGTQERLDMFQASWISSALWEGWAVVLGGRQVFSVHRREMRPWGVGSRQIPCLICVRKGAEHFQYNMGSVLTSALWEM